MVVSCWASLIDSIFVAFRNAKFILVKNVTFSSLKIVFPFLFLGLGAYGIFGAWMTSLFVAVVLSMFILVKKFDYKPKLVFHDSIIKKIGKYSFGNYVAGFIGGLPLMILPLMILNSLGAETTAYYYMAMMIATLLFTIPQATSQSLFAEGSYDEKNLKVQVWKAVKIISLILIPGILITVFFGNWILLLFGKEYSSEGFRFLQILALSGIFVGGNKVFENVLRIEKRIRSILWVNIIGAVVILGGSYLLLGGGLLSIGYVWLGGQVVISLIYLGLLKR